MSGKLIVISGPSGVGKSTVMRKLMEDCDNLRFSVSATTRPIRPGEVDGVNYYFVSKEQFEDMIQKEELLEYANYVGNYYGTPEKQLNEKLEAGYDILLDIEVQGAMNVRARRQDAVLIFLLAPSFTELARRLNGRGDTPPDKIAQRLERARWEYSQAPNYDYFVVNDSVEHAVEELRAIITAEKCKANDRMHYLKEEP